MDTTRQVELDHRAVQTFRQLSAWAVDAFSLIGGSPPDLEGLTREIWQQAGERAVYYRVVRRNPESTSEPVAQALEIWQPYFGLPMFHDWGCSVEFAA